MNSRANTPSRILDAAQDLFNKKGYAATTMAEIASSIGISPGNLTYHFPSKRDLVTGIRERTQAALDARWEAKRQSEITDDYIEHLLFAMRLTWDIRFLLQDSALSSDEGDALENNPYMKADYEELAALVERIAAEGLLRSNFDRDLDVITRTLWVNSRFWMDHLLELEGPTQAPWDDLERGIRHHLALLDLFLTPEAIARFEATMESALRFMKSFHHGVPHGVIPQIA